MKIVAYRHDAKPFTDQATALTEAGKWLSDQPENRWSWAGMRSCGSAEHYPSFYHRYGGPPQYLSNDSDTAEI